MRYFQAHIYHGNAETEGKVCAAFLTNIDEHKTAYVKFNGQSYTLPPWSVSTLPHCRHVAYNTAKVGAQTSVKTVESAGPPLGSMSIMQKAGRQDNASYISKSWMALKEPIGIWGENNFTTQGLLEHLNVTKDQSDYLWHKTRISVTEDDISFWKKNGANPTLSVDSMRDVLRVFVNKQLSVDEQLFLHDLNTPKKTTVDQISRKNMHHHALIFYLSETEQLGLILFIVVANLYLKPINSKPF